MTEQIQLSPNACIICKDRTAVWLNKNCIHRIACETCFEGLVTHPQQSLRCPLCREEVTEYLNVSTSESRTPQPQQSPSSTPSEAAPTPPTDEEKTTLEEMHADERAASQTYQPPHDDEDEPSSSEEEAEESETEMELD